MPEQATITRFPFRIGGAISTATVAELAVAARRSGATTPSGERYDQAPAKLLDAELTLAESERRPLELRIEGDAINVGIDLYDVCLNRGLDFDCTILRPLAFGPLAGEGAPFLACHRQGDWARFPLDDSVVPVDAVLDALGTLERPTPADEALAKLRSVVEGRTPPSLPPAYRAESSQPPHRDSAPANAPAAAHEPL